MAETYTPPKSGSPCWIAIPASDVSRAKEFYAKVFAWDFKPATEAYPAERVALFSFPDPKLAALGGGIVARQEGKELGRGTEGVVVYLFADGLDEKVATIKEAGGKPLGDKFAEGTSGWIQLVEDTEGNTVGLWAPAKTEGEDK